MAPNYPTPVTEAPTMLLIFVALILFGTSLRWYLRSCEDFSNHRTLSGWVFLLGSFVWMGLSGCLAYAATL